MCTNSEGSGETARMRRIAWALAGRLCDKYHNLLCWVISVTVSDFFTWRAYEWLCRSELLLLPVPGRPATFAYSRARACCACSRCGTGGLYLFYFSSIFPSNVLSFGRQLNMTEILWFRLLKPNGSCQLLPRTSLLSTGQPLRRCKPDQEQCHY